MVFWCPVLSAVLPLSCMHTLSVWEQKWNICSDYHLWEALQVGRVFFVWLGESSVRSEAKKSNWAWICSFLCVSTLFYFALPFWVKEDEKHLINRSLDKDMCCYAVFESCRSWAWHPKNPSLYEGAFFIVEKTGRQMKQTVIAGIYY